MYFFNSFCILLLACNVSAYANNHKAALSPNSRIGEFLLHGLYSGGTGKGADFDLTHKMYTHINPYYVNMLPENSNKTENLDNPQNSDQSVNFTTDDQSPTIYTYQPGGGYTITKSQSVNADSAASPSAPASSYFPSDSSTNSYLPPSNSYPPPENSFSRPMASYGPPINSYPNSIGTYPPTYPPPTPPPQMYGPPPPHFHHDHHHHDIIYTPHKNSDNTLSWLWAKITKKFDLLLISKIVLKLIIFKKIIKFIAIICLLLFIPQLMKATVSHSDNDSDSDRNLDAYAKVDQKIKEIFNFASTAIEGFAADNIAFCTGQHEFYCRFQYALDSVDQRYDTYSKILTVWFPNLTTTQFPSTTSDLYYLNSDFTESPINYDFDDDENIEK